MSSRVPARRGGPRQRAAAVLLAAALVVVGACSAGATQQPTDANVTVIPLQPTGWPDGTTGRWGLKVDPTLLAEVPAMVSGQPVYEAADIEVQALDDQELAGSLEAIAAGRVGSPDDPNWAVFTVGRTASGALTDEFYAGWRDDYGPKTCSRADGVSKREQQTFGAYTADVTVCAGGVDAYTLRLGPDLILSVQDLGPRRLGGQLIAAIQ